MVKLKNLNYGSYLKHYGDKRVILYGAGGTLKDFIRFNRAKIKLLDKIDYILDSDKTKSGTTYSVGLHSVAVATIEEFTSLKTDLADYVIILCVNNNFLLEVINALDHIRIFDNIVCIYGITALSWGRSIYFQPQAGKVTLPKRENRYNIPKLIHYVWFGGNDLSKNEKECIASWKEHCPDYEIKLWNEDNYDIARTPLYVRQAYEAKKYAFVSDYARLDIVYRHGGFYLDADVLLLRSLDDFINYKAVYGYLAFNEIATGLGFGSLSGNIDLLEQMKIYEHTLFVNEGELNLTPCPEYSTDYFIRKGIAINNTVQFVDDALFLPSDFFCSLMPVLDSNGQYYLSLYALTENSYALHKCASSWFEADNYGVFENSKIVHAEINKRMLADWKKELNENA